MKLSILLMFFVTLFLTVGCVATYRTLPTEQQTIQTVHVTSLPKTEVFSRAKQWFAQNLGKSNEALQIQDLESGIIAGHIILPDAVSIGFGLHVDLKCFVKMEIKEGKYRISFEDLLFWNKGSGRDVNAGMEYDSAVAELKKVEVEIFAAITNKPKSSDF